MEFTLYLLLLSFCIFENGAANKYSGNVELLNDTKNYRLSFLHTIEEDLLRETWKEEHRPCLHQLLKVIKNVQNSTVWATWIWDSMQFPVGHLYGTRTYLGNFDQCMDSPWKDVPEFMTQYCLAELTLSELDPAISQVGPFDTIQKYIQLQTKHGLTYNTMVWGICTPVACKPQSIAKFAASMFRSTHLGQIDTRLNITVNSESCLVPGEIDKTSVGEYVFFSLVIFAIIVTFLCTLYASLKGDESKSTVLDYARAFHLKPNAERLVKLEDQSIRSVLGIRMISLFLVLSAHQWIIKNIVGIINAGEIVKKLDDFSLYIFFNVDMVVDTFFMLSGLLVAKSLMQRIEQNKRFNPLAIITKRYIRLMFSVILILLIQPIVLLSGEPAPLVNKYLREEVDACTDNWWRTVLMIDNYGNTENMCYPSLWSMACDFHLFVVSILIFCIYRKNRTAGIQAYIVCASSALIIPAFHGYIYKNPAVVSLDFRLISDPRQFIVGDAAYVRTHLRAGPYFVGVAVGYLMALFDPNKYRNYLSKKSSVSAFISFLAMFVLLNVYCSTYQGRVYSPLEGALFAVMRKNVFVALVAYLIIICEYGTLPVVSSILGWSGLVPLSKLSYGVYLNHIAILLRIMFRTRAPMRSSIAADMYSTFGLLALTMSVSLYMWLFWEAPATNIIYMMFKRSAGKTREIKKIDKIERTAGNTDTARTDREEVSTLEKKLN